MDSLECKRFRKMAGAAPRELDEALLAHGQCCPDCADFAEQNRLFDELLLKAVEVEVPESLKERVLALPETNKAGGGHQPTTRYPLYAMAASVLLVIGLFTARLFSPGAPQTFDQLVFQHIEEEPEILVLADYVLPVGAVEAELKGIGIGLKQPMNGVMHVSTCDIGDTFGVHVVLRGEKGPVTLLFLPEVNLPAYKRLEQKNWSGYAEPLNNRGVLAVVGEQGEPLDKIESAVRDSIEWL